ncbi:unnamed protein product [Calicophoron daubneyi]|uniref:Uncharacterized protein n=1 Tax=Calicophoron daubneyi TaxID=300641 RepID=A0AAV2TBX3_CALDB
MALRYIRQLPSQHAALETHGKLSVLAFQRKKWRTPYAQLDRKQGILTLQDREKHKTERFYLPKCDCYSVHFRMFDRERCFDPVFCGVSPDCLEELVLPVDPQPTGVASSRRLNGNSSKECNIYAYAGRLDDLVLRLLIILVVHAPVKISSAKLVLSKLAKSRRDDPFYTILLDGIEIARAYSGSALVVIVFDGFPNDLKKVEILTRVEIKKRRSVNMDLKLPQRTSDLSTRSDRCHSVFKAQVRPTQSSKYTM